MSEDTDLKAQMANFIGGEGLVTKEETPAEPKPQEQDTANDTGNQEEPDESGSDIDDTDDDDGDAGGDGEEGDLEGRKRKRSGADRYRRQRERAEAAEQRAAALEARLAALEKGQQPEQQQELTNKPQNETNAAGQAPDPAKYQYGDLDPQFIRDLARFEAKQEFAELRQQIQATEQQKEQLREAEVIRDKALETAKVGSERYPDFMDVVVEGAENNEWPLTETMLSAALESEKSADILYYLATHPDEAAEVSRMGVRQQDRWFGRMEATLKAPQPRKVSKAPQPVSSARGAGGKFAPSPATTDFAAFEQMATQRK
jgi:hypothetical protein